MKRTTLALFLLSSALTAFPAGAVSDCVSVCSEASSCSEPCIQSINGNLAFSTCGDYGLCACETVTVFDCNEPVGVRERDCECVGTYSSYECSTCTATEYQARMRTYSTCSSGSSTFLSGPVETTPYDCYTIISEGPAIICPSSPPPPSVPNSC